MINASEACFFCGLKLESKGGATNLEHQIEENTWAHVAYRHAGVNDFLGSLGLPERIVNSMVRQELKRWF